MSTGLLKVPSSKAVVVAVGAIITSKSLKIFLISFVIIERILSAFL